MSCIARCCRRAGQSMVELALILLLIMVLLIGVVEFGFLLYAHVQVANGAREAARAASLYRSHHLMTMAVSSSGAVESCGSVGSTQIKGWTLQQVVDQSIVYRALDGKGCPGAKTGTAAVTYTSLGLLSQDAARWTVTVTPDQSSYCATSEQCLPRAGTSGTIVLSYSYQLPIVSSLIPVLTDPVEIRKAIDFEYQR